MKDGRAIVEILNLSSNQVESIRLHRCLSPSELLNVVKQVIGMKYFVEKVNKEGVWLKGWNHGGSFDGFFTHDQVA